jgi:hypothetical protein
VCQRLEESQNLASKVTGPIVMKLHHGDKPMTPEGDHSIFLHRVLKSTRRTASVSAVALCKPSNSGPYSVAVCIAVDKRGVCSYIPTAAKQLFAPSSWRCHTSAEQACFNELVAKLRTELGYWESYLAPNLHVAGREYTVADIATGELTCCMT